MFNKVLCHFQTHVCNVFHSPHSEDHNGSLSVFFHLSLFWLCFVACCTSLGKTELLHNEFDLFFLPFVYVTVCVHRLVLCLTLGICGLPCHFVWPSCPFVTCFSYRGTGWMSRGAPFLRLLRYNSSCSNTNYSFSLSTAAPPYLTLTDMAIISAFSITTCSS